MSQPASDQQLLALPQWQRVLLYSVWWVLSLAGIGISILTILIHFRLVPLSAPEILAAAGPQTPSELFNLLLFAAVVPLSYTLAGFLIYSRKRHDPFGLLVSYTLITSGTAVITADWTAIASFDPRMTLVMQLLQIPGFSALLALFFVFPDGRFVPRWTRWMALTTPFISSAFELYINTSIPPLLVAALVIVFVLGLISQIIRYRTVSTGIQRQQTKWVIVGFGTLIIGVVMWMVVSFVMPDKLGFLTPVLPIVGVLTSSALPFTLVLSILRYRLWDIDLIIRRTLIYSLITVIMALIYLGGVALMQSIFIRVTGNESPLAIVVSTLGIAALFNPMRRRVQDFIDQRFYRRKYDAELTIDAFAHQIRDEVDIERLQASLLSVIEDTMHPEHVSLWIPAARKPVE